MLLGLTSAVMAIGPAELDTRIRTLTDKFEAFQHRPDNGIPPEALRQAQGIILLNTVKGGLVFGYQGGNGLAMVKDSKMAWSPAAFVKSSQGSFGAQIGGEQNFYVILLMTTNSTWRLIDPKIQFGAGVGGTANTDTGGVQTKTPDQQEVVVYNDRVGLYGGAIVKAGGISPDPEANSAYYGQDFSMRDILFDHKVQPGAAISQLEDRIDSYSRNLPGSKSAKN